MNTLDSILPELRSLLPVSLRGAYLDGYLQRRRTPMELLLSRSLPNVDVAASTFEDLRAEIRSLGLPLWVANRYLTEAEQALAVGHDTREVVAAAKAWLATKLENPPAEDASCHVCSETGKKSCTACGTEIASLGAHGEGCPRCAEQEMDVIDAAQEDATAEPARRPAFAPPGFGLDPGTTWPTEPRSIVAPQYDVSAAPIDRFMAAYEPALYEALKQHPDEYAFTAAEVPTFLPQWRHALLTQDFNHHGYAIRGACKKLGIKCTKKALLAFLRPGTTLPEPRESPAPLRQTADVSGMATRERYRQQVQAIGLPFDEQNVLMTVVDQALMFGQDADAIIARARESLLHDASAQRLPSVDEMPSRWMSGDHVIGPNGENGTIVRLEDRGEYGWHLKLDRPPGAHWQSAAGFRRVSEQSHEPPLVPPESPETPLHQQDRHSVDVLDRLVAALSEVFIVTPIRSGHGYRVVDLRSSVDFGVYKGLPRNTYLTTVSLRHSGPSEIIGDKAYLVQATREAGLSHDQYRAIRQFVAETVERLTDEAQGKAPPEPEMPDDGEVTTKTFATRMPTKYLRDFFAEKDIPEQNWTLRDSSGMEHHISNLVVVEHIAQTNKTEADAIANTLRRLDFANQDINGYLKHLAHALIEHKVSSVQDTQDPPVTPADAPRIFVAFSHPISPRLAAYYKPGRPGDPARFADLPALPDKKIREQMAAINSLPPEFAEALKRYMGVIADLNMEETVRNHYGVWQTPAILAQVGPANVKIERINRQGDGQLAEHGSIHTLVRRKDGAILKFGAPPASAVRGNIYRPESEIRMSINHVASVSRR